MSGITDNIQKKSIARHGKDTLKRVKSGAVYSFSKNVYSFSKNGMEGTASGKLHADRANAWRAAVGHNALNGISAEASVGIGHRRKCGMASGKLHADRANAWRAAVGRNALNGISAEASVGIGHRRKCGMAAGRVKAYESKKRKRRHAQGKSPSINKLEIYKKVQDTKREQKQIFADKGVSCYEGADKGLDKGIYEGVSKAFDKGDKGLDENSDIITACIIKAGIIKSGGNGSEKRRKNCTNGAAPMAANLRRALRQRPNDSAAIFADDRISTAGKIKDGAFCSDSGIFTNIASPDDISDESISFVKPEIWGKGTDVDESIRPVEKGNNPVKNREYRYYYKIKKSKAKKRHHHRAFGRLLSSAGKGIKGGASKAGKIAEGAVNTVNMAKNIGKLGALDGTGNASGIAALKHQEILRRFGSVYAFGIQNVVMAVGKISMSLIIKLVKLIYKTVSGFLAAIMGTFLAIPLSMFFIILVLTTVPPLSWMAEDYEGGEMIIISYQDKLREFGLSVDSYEADDTSEISCNLDADRLRKDALALFLAKKGADYDFNSVTEEDAALYGELVAAMINCKCDVSLYAEEIEDGSLLAAKELDVAVRKSELFDGNSNGAYRYDSCNVHGVTSQINTSDGSYTHTIREWYFIPCEVSQYSILPLGTCLELTVADRENNKEKYVLQVVAKMEDDRMDNEMLYLCGDWGTELDGRAKDENINTVAYGALSWFSYDSKHSPFASPDDSVCYTGILDKKRYASPLDTYNLRYRSASSLAEEFGICRKARLYQ